MSSLDRPGVPPPPPARTDRALPDHPVRVALLDLLAEAGTVTATEAAGRLGYSSGLCSFHLRQLARYRLIEEVPQAGGRAKPWRLRWGNPDPPELEPEPAAELTSLAHERKLAHGEIVGAAGIAGSGERKLARELEDESYQRWLAQRDGAPQQWRRDESFSAVVHLTPAEAAELAETIRGLLAGYRDRGEPAAVRPDGAVPVAAVIRIFPLHG